MNSAHGYTEGADDKVLYRDSIVPPSWVKEYELVTTQPQVPIWTINWNHHAWTFTSEEEAWLFAAYWKLI